MTRISNESRHFQYSNTANVSTNPSDQISPKSARTPGKGSGRMGIFSVECKLHEEDISRWRVKEIIMKMISAGLQSKFNFIVAPKISAQIEFEFDLNFNAKFKQIKKLTNLIESLNSTKTKSTSSKDSTENDSKQKLANEKARLQKNWKIKFRTMTLVFFGYNKAILNYQPKLMNRSVAIRLPNLS